MRKSNYVPVDVDFDVPAERSKTVPDLAVSPQEIMRRFTVGMEPGVPEIPAIYMGSEDDLEALARMDFADQREYAERLKSDREAAFEHIRAIRADKEAERKALNERRKADIEAVLAARRQQKEDGSSVVP